jgi:hypothetical protein
VRSVVEQNAARHPHRGHPVGEGMVDAPDQRSAAALDGDDVQRPQRPIAWQPLRHQRPHLRWKPLVVDTTAVADLAGDLEARVRLPGRRASFHQPQTEPALAVKPRLDMGPHVLDSALAIENDQLAGVAAYGPGLERKDRGVVRAQRFGDGRRHAAS